MIQKIERRCRARLILLWSQIKHPLNLGKKKPYGKIGNGCMSISSHLEGRRGDEQGFKKRQSVHSVQLAAHSAPLTQEPEKALLLDLIRTLSASPSDPKARARAPYFIDLIGRQNSTGMERIGSFLYLQFLPTKTCLAATIEAGGRAHHMIPAERERGVYTPHMTLTFATNRA